MSISRRRVLALLTLTTILLLTFDLRGSSTINTAKRIFGDVMQPLQDAGRVVARPIENAWHGVTSYDRLNKENAKLRDQIAAQQGDSVAAAAAVREYLELQTLAHLDTPYSHVDAQVEQYSSQNFEQTVEINRGSDDGIKVGMAVVSPGGLIGKITRTSSHRAVVMLLTDTNYTVSVKINGNDPIPGSSNDPSVSTTTTVPAGGAVAPATTIGGPQETGGAVAPPLGGPSTTEGLLPPDFVLPADPVPESTTTTVPATTTTLDPTKLPQRELGGLSGQGQGKLPVVTLISNDRRGLDIKVGDVVVTSGGCPSLAPPDLAIGRVGSVTSRPGSQGPEIEVQPSSDLGGLNFVQVILYLPAAEVSGQVCD